MDEPHSPITALPKLQPVDLSALGAFASTAVRIADRAIICDVECEGVRLTPPRAAGHPLYDVSAMLDEREHSTFHIDMAREGLAYGIARGLLALEPTTANLVHVRITRRP